MPAVARSDGNDKVFSKTGTGKDCNYPNPSVVTGAASCEVYANNYKIVRESDIVGAHLASGCEIVDISTMTEGSSTVFIGGKKVARIGDNYGSDNIITSGSYDVFVGG